MNRTRFTTLTATAVAGALTLAACGSSSPASTSSSSATSSSSSSSSSSSTSSSAPAASSAPAGSSASSGSSEVASSAPASSAVVSSAPASSAPASQSGSGTASAPASTADLSGVKLSGTSLTIGSANFSESVTLADLYGEALKGHGASVTLKPKIGSREVYIPALKQGGIDLIPEYSGTLLQYLNPKATQTSSADVYAALPAVLGSDLKVLAQSSAQDKDAIVVTSDTATKNNLKSIADLSSKASSLTLGGSPEFKTRADGVPGLKSKYNVVFGTYKTLDAGGPLTVNALKNGQIDAGDIFTTDPSIPENNFVVLTDPQNLYAAQNVLPLISAKKDSAGIDTVLNAVNGQLTTDDLIALNKAVYGGADPIKTVDSWLTGKGLL